MTWQPGVKGRQGRWKAVYKGKAYYFPGGTGSTDHDAEQAAEAAWLEKKREIDEEHLKPQRQQFEAELKIWENVLAIARERGDAFMEQAALSKSKGIKAALDQRKFGQVPAELTFDGHFSWDVRYPAMAIPSTTIGEEDAAPASASGPRRMIKPHPHLWGKDDLAVERDIYLDRLAGKESQAARGRELDNYVRSFLEEKEREVRAGQVTSAWFFDLSTYLKDFSNWFGASNSIDTIDGATLTKYRSNLLQKVEAAGGRGLVAAEHRLAAAKSFIKWLYETDAITSLPKVLAIKSRALVISRPAPAIRTFTLEEIRTLLRNTVPRTQLFILLALNCGMTQKDISDLQHAEVDWSGGYIARKRSKTRKHKNVPLVRYKLWPETLEILSRFQSPAVPGPVLLNGDGRPLWTRETGQDGKQKRNDNIRCAFDRLCEKLELYKPFKCLKKTSSSLLRSHKDYDTLDELFLGHAPSSVSHRHYSADPHELFDEALDWLRDQYGLSTLDLVAKSERRKPEKAHRVRKKPR